MTNEEIKKRAEYIEIFATENAFYRDADSYEDGALWARDMQKAEDIEKACKILKKYLPLHDGVNDGSWIMEFRKAMQL